MKKNHVYGIGNALVDMEIEVDTEFLKKMNVDKGLMTLVDEKRQKELLEHVSGHQHKRTCGGSAANTIIAVSQFGGRSFYSCKVASDETGDFYYQDLKASGVETNLASGRESGVTGKCMVFITPDADRTMNTYLGITANYSENELDETELRDSEYLYIEGYLVTGNSAKKAAIKAKSIAESSGVKTALTFSDPGIVGHFKDGFKEILGSKGVDLLFCNEAEAMSFSDKDNVKDAMEELKKVSKAIAITMGAKGALLFDGENSIEIATSQVQAVDTNGAGDLFAGAFLYALTHGHTFEQAGNLACQSSSQLVTQFGPRLNAQQPPKIYQEILSVK